MGRAFTGLNGWGIYDLSGWDIYGSNGWGIFFFQEMLKNTGLVPDGIRSNLRGSKFKILLEGHARRPTHMRVLSHATIILLPSCSPPQLKIPYETLTSEL